MKRPPIYSDAQLLADLRRVTRELGRQPNKAEYNRLGSHSYDSLRTRFGSWEAAFEHAGLRYNRERANPRGRRWTSDEVRRDLRRVRAKLGRYPTTRDYDEHGATSVGTVYHHAGTRKWGEVLVRFLDLDTEQAPAFSYNQRERFRTTTQRLEELRVFARELGRSPSTNEARRAKIDVAALRRRCGTWAQVLNKAGLPPPPGKPATRATTTDEMLADVRRVFAVPGATLSSTEYRKRGRYSMTTLLARCGGTWDGVLEAAGASRASRSLASDAAQMSGTFDPVRDRLKESSVEAITEFFRNKESRSPALTDRKEGNISG